MQVPVDTTVIWNFATALLIGALLGIERERNKREHDEQTIGGLRTFILFALIGALGGWLTVLLDSPWILATTLLVALLPSLAGYVISARTQPIALGLTTEMAAIAACMLGALTMLGQREMAAGLGVAVAALLAYKQPLHGLVLRLDRDDVFAGLRLLIATFIVLPLLPDRTIDPWGALNPHTLWILVLLISSLSLVGYVATRLLGADRGIPITGISGGLVSSTAVTLSFARQSRLPDNTATAEALVIGILLSWTVMFARIMIMVAAVNGSLLPSIALPCTAMALTALGMGWWLRTRGEDGLPSQAVPLRNPFSLAEAAKFAAFFAMVLLGVKLVELYAPSSGLYLVASLAGATDVDAITLSMAQYARTESPEIAAHAIVIAALTNTVVKTGLATGLGSVRLRRLMLVAGVAVCIAGGLVLLAY